ncbi:MAG: hypothetical protein IT299_06230 [Dehalococcoidia bacterium]|nr:hypothetical protein [Dehalococcoidia bacterium]
MTELRPPESLLLPRDHLTVWVRAETWHCPYCHSPAAAASTVDWLGSESRGPSGRCRECGVKLVLARAGRRFPILRASSGAVRARGIARRVTACTLVELPRLWEIFEPSEFRRQGHRLHPR